MTFDEWFEQKKEKCEVYGNGDDYCVDDEIKHFCRMGYDFANKWYYPSKGEFPDVGRTCVMKYGSETKKSVVVLKIVDKCQYEFIDYWRYIELPKE